MQTYQFIINQYPAGECLPCRALMNTSARQQAMRVLIWRLKFSPAGLDRWSSSLTER